MAKDPAFLFYSSDFLLGSAFLTLEECGQYIKALCWLHQHGGRLSKEKMEAVIGKMSDKLLEKFLIDKNGMLFNKRLLEELEKRNKYCESRRNNAKSYAKHMHKHMHKHMENENENENKDVIKNNKVFNKPTIEEIEKYCLERNNGIDPEAFFHHYESCGWKIGSKPMKNWKSAIITWEKRDNNKLKPKLTQAQINSIAGMKRLEERWKNEERNNEEGSGNTVTDVSK